MTAAKQEPSANAAARLRAALAAEQPLLLPGAVNPYCAMMARSAGFRALYLSGGGVAAVLGMPDLAATTLHEVAGVTAQITEACELPLLVDADTGFGTWLSVARTCKTLQRAGAAGMHLEDQAMAKRCGHRPNKQIVATGEMCDRLRAAADARVGDDAFIIMARTDALASEPMPAVCERIAAYAEAGADMIFLEAAKTLDDYRAVKRACALPLLANITEFGQTPLFTAGELQQAGVDIMLFPLSAFRAMNQAAMAVYASIREHGTQQHVVDRMQTREELYAFLGYHQIEEKMNALFAGDGNDGATTQPK